ncbi:Cleavage polyadenylation factor subunit clp1 [Polyrhizophydium stewartii]|uniref:Polynucleotide 5'-hydroxyl-kinase GRC3 n=1 Tax=Polyrhizophydium stewartii TaxID=2732419 RepID=A0ABR4N8F7_9FUNG|nr:hypothetical protein HK105_007469 [Polyrhizophydium stewartii]
MQASQADTEAEPRDWHLEPGQEFRFEVDPGAKNKACLVLKNGRAEIFGSELAVGVEYRFTGRKLAVFTWHGCVLQISFSFYIEYIGFETPMQSFLSAHMALEQMRDHAVRTATQGPRVLIVGQADSGKTSLAKILINYAAKLSRRPLFVDIDPSQGSMSLPGTVGAMVISRPISCEEEFGAPLTVMGTAPIVFYHGHTSPLEKPKLYDSIIKKLIQVVDKKLESPDHGSSGIIVDTPSQFAEPGGFEQLTEAIKAIKANVVFVIGYERLYSDLLRHFGAQSPVSVLKLNKSGGVVTRDKDFRRKLQMQRVKEYFYGSMRSEMTPFSQTVSFSDIAVRRVGEGLLAPSSALPLGAERKEHDTKFVKVEPGDILLHSVLAVSHALLPGAPDASGTPTKIYTPDEESQVLLESNVAGFIYISEVEDYKRKMTVLSPTPGRLPKTFLIMGALKWMDM